MFPFQTKTPMKMPTASSIFSTYAFISTLLMLVRSLFNDLIPVPLRSYMLTVLSDLFRPRSQTLTLVIEEANANGIGPNDLYDAVEVYLCSNHTSNSATDRLKVSKSPKDVSFIFRFDGEDVIHDSYDGIPLSWRFLKFPYEKCSDDPTIISTETRRFYELILDKQYKDKVINSYLPYIMAKSKSIKDKTRALKLCTLGHMFSCGNVHWDTVNLQHPATFDTLAMDPDLKSAIIDDLGRFVKRREFYKRVGRAWKRGYLLYGPPGTGKSSLIAAMANYLGFDIYDLQLGSLSRDSDLRRLLLATSNRSILVIEDIDCSTEGKNRRKKSRRSGSAAADLHGMFHKPPEVQLTLSGLLNFIDGLWSSCGDERIIVFTTNHKEKLDSALLRPGRMDMHIHMSYLTAPGFRTLATNYLQIKGNHHLFEEIEMLLKVVKVTPAQVAEELMRSEDANKALDGVLKLLKRKKGTRVAVQKKEVKTECVNGGVTDDN